MKRGFFSSDDEPNKSRTCLECTFHLKCDNEPKNTARNYSKSFKKWRAQNKMRVGFFYDFDLTLTEEFQQMPIFREFRKELFDKYGILNLEDYFKVCDADISTGGVGCLEQIIFDSKTIFRGLNNQSMREKFAKQIKLAPGIPEWFNRINSFARSIGIEIEHHIISLGITSLIEGTSIFPYVNSIKGAELEDKNGALVLKSVIEPFRKVEHLKKVCKQNEIYKDLAYGDYRIPYSNAIVFGDGQSDRDLFRYVKQRGGTSIGVYEKGNKESYDSFIASFGGEKIKHPFVSMLVPRDYSENSILDILCKESLQNMINAEKECDMDYGLVNKYKVGGIRNNAIKRIVELHFNSCKSCQKRSDTKFYFQ